jgi:glutamine---fructose-6-phosphate transaminase (isomerizing)
LTRRSDPKAEFVVVHNGIITNYRELKAVLQNKGYIFETETDTECIAKLAKYIFDQQKGNIDFSQLAKLVVRELEGAYALLFKSVHYPNEIVATRKGSPLLIGVKTEKKLKVDFVDVEFGTSDSAEQLPVPGTPHLDLSNTSASCPQRFRIHPFPWPPHRQVNGSPSPPFPIPRIPF